MAGTARRLLAAIALPGLLASACDAGDGPAGTDAADGDTAVAGEVTVFAAASLTEAFTEIGEAFMAEHPGTAVRFNFAGSSELVTQIDEGAPADVFASADVASMTALTDAGDNASAPVQFATNVAEIIVAPGNPLGITSIADLSDDDLIVVLCSPSAPCGQYARSVLERAGVSVTPKSLEENVKAVVTKVTLGEADAGIVYATDVMAAGDRADGVALPADINVVAVYPIAVTRDAPNPVAAQAFVEFVTGERGQQILASYGFGAP